jgi:hypothetical protein
MSVRALSSQACKISRKSVEAAASRENRTFLFLLIFLFSTDGSNALPN